MRRAYLGVAIVSAVVLVSALLDERASVVFVGVVGQLASGLAAATAAFAIWSYRQGRDPSILLVGVGLAAVAGHYLVIVLLFALFGRRLGGIWPPLLGFSTLVGQLALVGTLLAVTPWRDRRGRPPMEPIRVVAAVVGGMAATDVLLMVIRPDFGALGTTSGLSAMAMIAGAALLAGGVTAAVRALPRGGRQGWIAAAALALALFGLTIVASFIDDAEGIRRILTWQPLMPTLAGASLVVFVLDSLHLQASRQRRATDRAAEVMEGRAEIASTIAHDVRGPVGTIKGLATTTRKSYDRLGDPERLEFIGMIEEESGRLLRLVDQVALALKVDAGSLDLTAREQSVAPLLRQAVEQTDASQHRITTQADPRIEVPADTRWVIEAVRQGLDNACGFSPVGSEVLLTVTEDAETVAITIVDQGPGIPEPMREAMFEKFSRWRPTGFEDRQGSGLGLFITRGVARAHGGDARLDEASSGGTMLRIQLPREGNRE